MERKQKIEDILSKKDFPDDKELIETLSDVELKNFLKTVISHPEFNFNIGDSSNIFEKDSAYTSEKSEKQVYINTEKDEVSLEINPVVNKEMDVQDITHIAEEDDSLSLEKREKELIIKALQKNNNKRKYAAQNLGISERTLYRKIKQYQIDE